jgi:PEP-CTERM motif
MKRSVLLGILGIAVATAASNSFGQGGINIGNYQAPFNQVLWGLAMPPSHGQAVHSTDGVSLALWWGQGDLTGINSSTPLSFGVDLPWKTDSEAIGYFGYYQLTQATLVGWNPGETWTFQVRAYSGGPEIGSSIRWTENANIRFIGGTPPGIPGLSANSIGLVIGPEPSTFALMGLSLAGFAFFRRRG